MSRPSRQPSVELFEVVDRLAHARTLPDVQQVVREAARGLTGADGATFVLRDGDCCFYADEDAIAPLWKGQRLPLTSCISGWAMLNRQSVAISDIYADERVPHAAYRPTFVKSLAMVPIRISAPVGAIGVYWARKHQPTRGELDLLQMLANSASVALENVNLAARIASNSQAHTAAIDAAERAQADTRREVDERLKAEASLRRAEDQLRQAQKMEAMGRLAGGVAHDFNNLLTVILSYGRFVAEDLGQEHPSYPDVLEITQAAERGAELTRQLLAFSRRQVVETVELDVNEVLRGMEKMLRRLIGEDVSLSTVLAPELGRVQMDPGHLEQLVMNLVVNARDAMPDGGKLTLETSRMMLDRAYARGHLEAKPGPYVMLAVSDTGVGIPPELQQRIFEPFFTTKEKGHGTGLGLSTVYGIVKQSGGDLHVYSHLGRGTTFKIYLPLVADVAEVEQEEASHEPTEPAVESILLVEDEPAVRAVASRAIRKAGYRLFEAADPAEALALADEQLDGIHLLVTDVVMPEMNGRELAERLSGRVPGLRVLFMSGYTGGALAHQKVLAAGAAHLQKPFTPDALIEKIRAALSQPNDVETW
jgi:signal transduction histidine kinase/ActR/RegA family two-component response regulator